MPVAISSAYDDSVALDSEKAAISLEEDLKEQEDDLKRDAVMEAGFNRASNSKESE